MSYKQYFETLTYTNKCSIITLTSHKGRVVLMNNKEKIVKLINEIENEKLLAYLYEFIRQMSDNISN